MRKYPLRVCLPVTFVWAVCGLAGRPAVAQDSGAANNLLRNPSAAAARGYSPMIFSGFLEHFHGQVYGGVFDPGSPLSDEKGFRKDVIAAMKELKLSTVRGHIFIWHFAAKCEMKM